MLQRPSALKNTFLNFTLGLHLTNSLTVVGSDRDRASFFAAQSMSTRYRSGNLVPLKSRFSQLPRKLPEIGFEFQLKNQHNKKFIRTLLGVQVRGHSNNTWPFFCTYLVSSALNRNFIFISFRVGWMNFLMPSLSRQEYRLCSGTTPTEDSVLGEKVRHFDVHNYLLFII